MAPAMRLSRFPQSFASVLPCSADYLLSSRWGQSRLTSIAALSETTREFSRLRRGRDGAVGCVAVVLFAVGAAFDAGGGEPGVELDGVAAVEVLHIVGGQSSHGNISP